MINVAVIGGGASGLMAAIVAARCGASVTVLERGDRVGRKILATGNGRCNMTNVYADVGNYHGENPKFVMSALSGFGAQSAMDFFAQLGVLCRVEEDGKVYPYSNQASSVLDVMRMETAKLGVAVKCNFEVMDITVKDNKFYIKSYQDEVFVSDKVIFAAGGKAAPNLGSNGSGYDILRKLGHTVTPLFPALVQIKTDTECVRGLKGIKIDANVAAVQDGKKQKEEYGEVLFTEYGLSGPPVFQLSRTFGEGVKNGKKCAAVLDIMPEYTKQQVKELINERIMYNGDKTLENFFVGMLNKRLGQILLKACGVFPLSEKAQSLTKNEVSAIAEKIKNWSFDVTGTMSWNNAQVTAGGVRTKEISPSTMESKIVKGLYIVGEIMDIDGDCGGFNLQWAWSSAYAAGRSVVC